jgi:hypothetical protein
MSCLFANWEFLKLLPQAETCQMLICAAGDIHVAMDRLYHDVLAFEAFIDVRFDCVLQVGDFGPARVAPALVS